MRLFETLSQVGALWVFLGTGLALGVVELLMLSIRLLAGDPLWLRILFAPVTAGLWIVATIAAVEYAYPHGFRAWQAVLEGVGCAAMLLGPGSYAAQGIRNFRRKFGKVA